MKRKIFILFITFHFFLIDPFGGIRSSAQIINTIAGNGIVGNSGDGGPATTAEIIPNQLAIDILGNVYISDYDTCVRKINTSGIINTFAGNGYQGYSGDGGPATAAELYGTNGMATDDSGNIYIADTYNYVIRKVNTSGIISTFAGNGYHYIGGGGGYSGDGGPATSAELNFPMDVALDKLGNVYIADDVNQVIRKVNTSGIISTIAGNGYRTGILGSEGGFSGDGGPATAAELWGPGSIAVDNSGNIYIGDGGDSHIRKVNTSDTINSIAGNGVSGYSGDGGLATAAEISEAAVSVDESGNVYLPDADYNRLRKVNTSDTINIIAGNGYRGFSGDGGPATNAELNGPFGVAVDKFGNLYVADHGNARVRKIWMVLNVSTNITNNVICNGGNNDSAIAIASEGTNPYTYSWFPTGGSNSTATGLSAGTYTVFVTDSNNIKGSATVTITQPPVLTVSDSIITNIFCYGGNGGSASTMASGGTSPYHYLWSDANSQTTISASGLTAGTYTANVTDYNGCSVVSTVTITQPMAISLSADSSADHGSCNGSAWVMVNGGTAPYSYFWTGGLTTDTIRNQCLGNYCATIIDAHGCIDSVCTAIESATEINNVSNSQSINIYPDPNSGKFILSLSNINTKCSVEIFDILGNKIYNEILPQVKSSNIIDLTAQSNGIYFYRVLQLDGNIVGSGKFIVER